MTLGAEPKKVALLAVLLIAAVYIVFFNPFSDTASPAQTSTPTPRPSPATTTPGTAVPNAPPVGVPGYNPPARPAIAKSAGKRNERVLKDFRPSLKPSKDDPGPDPMTADPTLRLDILARLQKVKVEGTHRSLFEISAAPPPDPAKTQLASAKTPVPSPFGGRMIGPEPPPKPAPKVDPPPPPPPPPPPFKFYGFMNAANQGAKRAFFLEGDDIHVVTEGDVVKRRYRIVRIGVNSVVVEDTENRHQSTLPLEEPPA